MKHVVITGANQGIGYYIAKELLKNHYNVTILDKELDRLNELKTDYEDSCYPLCCDVRNEEEIIKSVNQSTEKYGGVDIAIHNACICTFKCMEQTDMKTYHDVFDVNFFSAIKLAKAVIPYMKNKGSGRIIFVSSGIGIMGFVNISPYATSKGALESLAKCLNIEYKNTGITFHIFHPPLTRTKSSSPLPIPNEFMADPEKVGTGLAKHINKKSFIICHSFPQKLQTKMAYLFSIRMGKFLSKMTANYSNQAKDNE